MQSVVRGGGQQELRRALETRALKARLDAEAYARKLEDQPFWRFRRRQTIGKALAVAQRRELEARRLLDDAR